MFIYLGKNLVNCVNEDAVQGVVQNSGDVHLWAGSIKQAHTELLKKEIHIGMADNMINSAIRHFRKTDSHIFADYRIKEPSQTRYYRRVDARINFIFNEKKIYGEFQSKWSNDPAFQAYRNNRFNVQWVIITELKIEEVCLFKI